ncbi:MAG: tyrosine-type recombinase/integrase [Bacteroidetes bacterium]|nr:tyrosine-type recombinase/integrase [Bacteroidota bacterium]
MKLNYCLQKFFTDYLISLKGVSPETEKSYKEAFKLFVKFSAKHLSKKASHLEIKDLTPALIFAFLDHLEKKRKNKARTRNARLIALKTFAKMLRLMHPEYRETSEMILNIPQKRFGRRLIGYMDYEDILKVFESVDLQKKDGFRDYTILHLLFDSGARASELANLETEFFDPHKKSLIIKGKGDNYRLIGLEQKTVELLECYIKRYRDTPKPLYSNRLFINQRREGFTRNGIYRLCRKHVSTALPVKQFEKLNPVHSFRHSCAVHMLLTGKSLTDIKNHLGHENLKSTMIYLHLSLSRKREVQRKYIEHMENSITIDPNVDDFLKSESKEEILRLLDSL